jgi:DNA invertase Pin-like site-specific DNA recombinase
VTATTKPNYVAIYGRASLDRDELRISVDRQTSRCERLAHDLFPNLAVRTFTDNNLSASNPDVVRPGYEALLSAIRRGEVDEVVCHEQSRLTRQPGQWDDLVVTLTRAGITKIHTVQQGIVSVEAGNRLVGRILNVIDAEESERIKARATAMHDQLAVEGRPNGGRYYGYRLYRGPSGTGRPELVVDDAEAAVIRRVTDELLAGHSANAVAEGLAADGIASPRGGRWRGKAVLSLVRRPHIAGLRVHHGRTTPAQWPAIIPAERWETLQRVTASPTVTDANGTVRPRLGAQRADGSRKWLLTGGLARCGLCGARLTVALRGRPGNYVTTYGCSIRGGDLDACGKVSLSPAEIVEDLVVDRVKAVLADPDVAARLQHSDDPDRARLVAELTVAEARVTRAAELFGSGEIDEDTWRTMHAPAAATVEAARANLAAITPPDLDLPPADVVRDAWDDLPLKQRQAVLARYLSAVVVLPATTRPADHRERVARRLRLDWKD